MVTRIIAMLITLVILPVLAAAQALPPRAYSANPPGTQVLGIGVTPFFASTKFVIHQDSKPDISLTESLAFPRDFTVWRFDVHGGQNPIKLAYEYTPAIRGSGQGKLPTTLVAGGQTFGMVKSAQGQESNDPMGIEAQAARHRIELAYVFEPQSGIGLIPRFGAQFFPASFTLRNTVDSTKTASWSATPALMSAGLALERDVGDFAFVVGADYLTNKQANGYQLEFNATLLPNSRRFPIYLSAGYYIEVIQWRFDGGSLDSDTRGPLLRLFYRF